MGEDGMGAQGGARVMVAGFAAFISYSHADEHVAKRLHRRLETYRLPPQVRNATDDRKVGKVFRDRADFAAANSLTDAIREALSASMALIVLCSPDARKSPWVDAEIRLFRDLHPDAPVIAVILRGEPSEAMPAALTEDGREPLAADFRREADGNKLGFLKIVAALKRLPLDSLIQRDAQRNQRRVIVITVIVGAALLAMIAMTVLAVTARREADRQRAQAEGMVEYLVTDLRQELIGVGRIDVQHAVNDRALGYYRQQGDIAALPNDSLERRARVLQAMGQDELSRNNIDRAATLLDAAFDSTEALLAREPDNADRIFAHAQSEYWSGKLLLARGNASGYRAAMQRYLALALRLKKVDPIQLRAQREIGYAENNLCAIESGEDGVAGLSDHCVNALAAKRRALALAPTDRGVVADFANQLGWNATALMQSGQREESVRLSDEAVSTARNLLATDPANRDSQDLLGAMVGGRAELLVMNGQRLLARRDFVEAQRIFRELNQVDPANERWSRLLERYSRGVS
jgi:tetratricopeptide (TPR) repeat protein